LIHTVISFLPRATDGPTEVFALPRTLSAESRELEAALQLSTMGSHLALDESQGHASERMEEALKILRTR
jgi:hypothetical protein